MKTIIIITVIVIVELYLFVNAKTIVIVVWF